MDDTEKKPAVEHSIFGIQAMPGRDPDPTFLDTHVANGWAIGAAYAVAHPTGNTILHYFVLHRAVKPATKSDAEAPKGRSR